MSKDILRNLKALKQSFHIIITCEKGNELSPSSQFYLQTYFLPVSGWAWHDWRFFFFEQIAGKKGETKFKLVSHLRKKGKSDQLN